MQEWTDVRRRVLVDGASKRSVQAEYGIGWRTLKKMLENPEPPGYRQYVPRQKRRIGPYLPVISEILEADRKAPPKQRHTAKRIFERLRDEYGYPGGLTQVRMAVASRRRAMKEVYVPLHHEPGEAQFDFGEAWARIAGERCKAHFAVMSIPHSDAFFVKAYPRQCTETFQDGVASAFSFFEGVPTKIDFDNSKVAVARIIGKERLLTREFLRLESHFLFRHHFCAVRRGNEKGHVESLVGYTRRNFMVPEPAFGTWGAFNAYLEDRCRADLSRKLWGKQATKVELLEEDREAMLRIPELSFEPRRVAHTKANSLSLVRFDRNDYSVPTSYAYHDLVVSGGVDEVVVAHQDTVVARHRRRWGREGIFYDPVHYLALLERKPGALDVAKPLRGWELPECFALLRRRLEAEAGSAGTREYIKVLRLLEHASLRELTAAVREAIRIGATTSDVIECILRDRADRPIALFSLDRHPHLKPYEIEQVDLSAYQVLEGSAR